MTKNIFSIAVRLKETKTVEVIWERNGGQKKRINRIPSVRSLFLSLKIS